MNDETFYKLWNDALVMDDRELYIQAAEPTLAPEMRSKDKRVAYLDNLWDVAHTPLRAMIERSGLKTRAFAVHFCIPYRTVQNWIAHSDSERRHCPDYLRLMIAKELKML